MSLEKYKLASAPVAPEASVIKGEKWRITVLTPSLVRFEYAEDGVFEDRPTQSVLNRDFPTPEFTVKDDENELLIRTSSFDIHYDKAPFSPAGLTVRLAGGGMWHYGEEPEDLGGTARTLDRIDGNKEINAWTERRSVSMYSKQYDGELQLCHGLVSKSGFSYIDDSSSMCLLENGWIEPRKQGICDLYFFGYGHRYLETLKDFYHLCGKTPLLPRYAFGNWWSRYHRYDEKEYMELITRFEKEEIPFAVSVVDMDWHLVEDVDPKYGSGWTGYTWNPKLFPDPKRFMAWLHEHHLRITLNVHPADGIRAFEKLYEPVAVAMGIDPKTELPVLCDPADPKYMEVYFDKLHHPLEEEGVDFWWIDWQQGTVTKIPGLDPLWIFNHYHYMDNSWKGTRSLMFSRFAGYGSHRYPVGFSGDTVVTWDSLRFQPWFTSTASNVGYGWWSHDIGGHMMGYRDDELEARWYQFGVFSPINRLHSSNSPFACKEPWKYGRNVELVMKEFLRLRHALIPYLYTMNRRASRDGEPLILPMYYGEPEVAETYEVPNEYYFGTELICAPITDPMEKPALKASVQAWLPEGLWADLFTGMVYRGGRMMQLWRGLESIPVLMKAGAVVPMKNMDTFDADTKNPTDMEVRIFPAADNVFTLWEDPGDTPEDLDENWAATALSVNKTAGTFTIAPAAGNVSVIPEARSWKLVFTGVKEKRLTVTVNGEKLDCEICRDEARGTFTVLIPAQPVSAEIVVSSEGGFEVADNDIVGRSFTLLEQAQIDYSEKERLYAQVAKLGRDAVPAMSSVSPEPSIYGTLLEILLAE